MSAAKVAAAMLLAAGAYVLYRRSQDGGEVLEGAGEWAGEIATTAEDVLTDAWETTAEVLDTVTGGLMKISYMKQVTPDMLGNRNVQALLRVIRRGEGTADEAGYRRIFGGQLFESFADHPRITVKKSGYTSSAAGAYQILASTWDETARMMGLPDFSPRSQDLAAVGRIAARGALDDALNGRLEVALRKIAREWASLPGSPYGQPTISLEEARRVYLAAGGNDTVYA